MVQSQRGRGELHVVSLETMYVIGVWHSSLTCSCLEQLEQFQRKHKECDVTKVRAAAVLKGPQTCKIFLSVNEAVP